MGISIRTQDGSFPAPAQEASTEVPRAPFQALESLWVQVTGTLCNLRCTHCFISCSPDNHTLEFMEREQIRGYLEEAADLGVKEFYFTGGEPFLHPEMLEILADALELAPTTVLTNGVLITETIAGDLGELAAASPYSLEIRVSLDAPEEEANDRIRGAGVFRKALRGIRRLEGAGLLPIVTATELVVEEGWEGDSSSQGPETEAVEAGGHQPQGAEAADLPRLPAGVAPGTVPPPPRGDRFYSRFHRLLREAGVRRPRVKILPVFNMGMLEGRREGVHLTEEMLRGFDFARLQCTTTRLVAHNGVYACPILAGEAGAHLSDGSLAEALHPCSLYHASCTTCYLTGMTCGNY